MFSRQSLTYDPIPLSNRSPMDDETMLEASHTFLQSLKTRHTVRDFSDREVKQAVIENCIATAGRAPSGANHQPWHFVAVKSPALKSKIRHAAEKEEAAFYSGGASEEWIKALEPLGTGMHKPHLEIAPWLIVVFAQRWGEFDDGTRYKNYYVPESVGIASGFLIAALHQAGLSSLTHTPNPMAFLNELLGRPKSEKPVMIIAVGHPAVDATIPKLSTLKKPLDEIMTIA